MAKKERIALLFVVRKGILYAVTGMPERTTAPKETAHYIVYAGCSNRRHKMKINTVTFAKEEVTTETGVIYTKTDKTKVLSAIPNFEKVSGEPLKQLWEKCSPAFRKAFPL